MLNRKWTFGQAELLFRETLHERTTLFGWLPYFHFSPEIRKGQWKTTPSTIRAFSYLAHVEGIGEDEDVWVEVVGGEGEGEDLEIPDDPHPEEESQVDAHCVHLLRAAAARLARRAGKIKSFVLIRNEKILTDS